MDGLFVTSAENIRYLTGFSGSEGSLILTRDEEIFLTDGRYTAQAREQVADLTLIIFKEKWKQIGRILKKLRLRKVGFEPGDLTVACRDRK